ncbi:MAG: phytoene/squalene synthase family protein [Myxococcota bacterium]
MSERGVVEASRAVLSSRARSFRWAAQFLSQEEHDDAAIVYAFCREVDDAADTAESDEAARVALDALEAELDGSAEPSPMMAAFLGVAARRGIQLESAHELIKGVRSDMGEVLVRDDVELLRYCYRVAGTVGLMMCPVIGVHDPKALPYAVDLGVGMQLTNICRDVAEDARMGRVYLPGTRLRFAGTSHEELLQGAASRRDVARVVRDLIDLADVYYASADRGMEHIPERARLAILVASRVYRGIGVKLRVHGSDALAGRTVVSWKGKTRWVGHALAAFARTKLPAAHHSHDGSLHLALDGLYGANVP